MTVHHCIETFTCPTDALAFSEADRRKIVDGLTRTSGPGGFKPNELAHSSAIAWHEEAMVILVMVIVMGLPLLILPTAIYCLICGSWLSCALWLGAVVLLSKHPLPHVEKALAQTRFTGALYKYFSYRFVWADDAREKADAAPAWVGAGPPHGVLPFANVLSIPAINTFIGRKFVGAAASVVSSVPGLRYMGLYGLVDVSARSIAKTLSQGTCVGTVPDGIAGIFRCTAGDEVVVLRKRKGIAKLALRTGAPILPAYSIGNTTAFSAWFDKWGVLERISRKVQASFFLYWGRFYLPIPRRVNVTMLIGAPLLVTKVAEGTEPTAEQVDELHERLLADMEKIFNLHKHALGWGHKTIRFE